MVYVMSAKDQLVMDPRTRSRDSTQPARRTRRERISGSTMSIAKIQKILRGWYGRRPQKRHRHEGRDDQGRQVAADGAEKGKGPVAPEQRGEGHHRHRRWHRRDEHKARENSFPRGHQRA